MNQTNSTNSNGQPQETAFSYRHLPTQWTIIGERGQVLTEGISRMEEDRVARVMIAEDKSLRYLIAKCHYRIGKDGEKEFLTQLDQIPEALKKRPDLDYPFGPPIVQIYKYGERQIDPATGRIKGLD